MIVDHHHAGAIFSTKVGIMSQEIDIVDIGKVIAKYKYYLLCIPILVVALTIAYISLTPNFYQSTTTVVYSPPPFMLHHSNGDWRLVPFKKDNRFMHEAYIRKPWEQFLPSLNLGARQCDISLTKFFADQFTYSLTCQSESEIKTVNSEIEAHINNIDMFYSVLPKIIDDFKNGRREKAMSIVSSEKKLNNVISVLGQNGKVSQAMDWITLNMMLNIDQAQYKQMDASLKSIESIKQYASTKSLRDVMAIHKSQHDQNVKELDELNSVIKIIEKTFSEFVNNADMTKNYLDQIVLAEVNKIIDKISRAYFYVYADNAYLDPQSDSFDVIGAITPIIKHIKHDTQVIGKRMPTPPILVSVAVLSAMFVLIVIISLAFAGDGKRSSENLT